MPSGHGCAPWSPPCSMRHPLCPRSGWRRRRLSSSPVPTSARSSTASPRILRRPRICCAKARRSGAAEFGRRVAASELLEHATVFGHRYGTPRAPVEATLAGGRDIVSDIDWQGTQQLQESVRNDLVSVFVLPPSMTALEERLKMRAQDSADVVRQRMAKSADEMSHW